MAGYVSADGYGDVNLATQTAPSSRFKNVVFAKGGPLLQPSGKSGYYRRKRIYG